MRTPENSVQANSAEHLTGERQTLPSSTLRCPFRLAGHGTSTPVFYEKWGFVKGNPEPAKGLWSHRQDASLADPQGSASCGWEEVSEAMERAASTRRDGKFVGSETVAKHATAELAYVVEVEHLERPRFTEERSSPHTPCGSR